MKTKVRLIENGYNNQQFFRNLDIQILDKQYPDSKISDTLTVIGSITFQTDRDRESTQSPWYGMTYVINTDNFEHIAKMAKLARFIKIHSDAFNLQPNELLLLIGAEKHIIHFGDFLPESCSGMCYFKVFRNGNFYRKIIAPNEILAQKQLKKGENETMQFDHIIP